MTPQVACCGVRLDGIDIQEAVRRILTADTGQVVHLCNAYTLSLAATDGPYREMLDAADLNLPDGTPVAWVGRRRAGSGFLRAVRGPDLMREALVQSSATRHYLYGASEDTLQRLRVAIEEFAPRANIVGMEAPPFRELTRDDYTAAAARIRASSADVVWVGLGTPKQDWAAAALAGESGATTVPVGAAFDFLAGVKKEAPTWVRGTGFEWLFRLATEPRRLWRRYLVGNLRFVGGVLRDVRRGPDSFT